MPGLVAGLDALIVAVILLAASFAVSTVFRPLLVNVLAQAPFIGGWLASNVDNGLAGFQRAIATPLNNSLGLLSSSLDWVANQGRDFVQALKDLAGAALWSVWTLATVTIPHAVTSSESLVSAWVDAAKAWALAQVQALEARLGTEVAGVAATAAADTARVEVEALAGIQAAERVVLDEIRKLEVTTGNLFLQAEADLQAGVASAETIAANLVSRAREDLSAAVAAVEHDLQLLAAAERVALADTTSILGGDLQAAEARANAAIGALEQETQKTIQGILDGLPWQSLAAAVGAGEAVLQADVRTLVGLGAQEIRKQLGDAEAIRAKYAPQIQAALAQVRG